MAPSRLPVGKSNWSPYDGCWSILEGRTNSSGVSEIHFPPVTADRVLLVRISDGLRGGTPDGKGLDD